MDPLLVGLVVACVVIVAILAVTVATLIITVKQAMALREASDVLGDEMAAGLQRGLKPGGALRDELSSTLTEGLGQELQKAEQALRNALSTEVQDLASTALEELSKLEHSPHAATTGDTGERSASQQNTQPRCYVPFDEPWDALDPVAAAQGLSLLINTLNAEGVDYYVAYGTALGFVRDPSQGFIPWDRNVDLCVNLHELEHLGFHTAAQLYRKGMVLCHVTLPFEPLHFTAETDSFKLSFLYQGVYFNLHGQSWLPPTQHEDVLDDKLTVRMPADAEAYLAETYGDSWRTPQELDFAAATYGMLSPADQALGKSPLRRPFQQGHYHAKITLSNNA